MDGADHPIRHEAWTPRTGDPIPLGMLCRHRLPGFRASCLGVCVVYVLLGGGILLRGVGPSMGEYAVPERTLGSPHYVDAIIWVYTHMIVIGLMVGVVGLHARSAQLKAWFSRLMLAAHLCYLFLDTRSSDSPLGNGLYEGPQSIGPAIVALVIALLFAHLSFCDHARS